MEEDAERDELVTGVLCGTGVLVVQAKVVEGIYGDGCFGKGMLSRSRPEYFAPQHVGGKRRRQQQASAALREDVKRGKRTQFHTKDVQLAEDYDQCRADHIAAMDESKRMEPLHLSFLEAFFLVDVLRRLRVVRRMPDMPDEHLDAADCWRVFCKMQGILFAYHYAAYCHYRREWTVRSGLKYGSDLVLYHKDGPSRFHAQHAVTVLACRADKLARCVAGTQRFASFRRIQALSRVTEQVAKGMVLCYVVRPADMSPGQLAADPRHLARLMVQEVRMSRLDPCKVR